MVPQEPLDCTIVALSHGPWGIARTEEGVVMIRNTTPGDVVRARVTASRSGYREADLVEVLEPSPTRRTPPCPYVPECGGCPWQHVDYPAQLEAKERNLRRELSRAGIDPDTAGLRPVLGTSEWAYRHRIRLRVDDERRFGFYQHRSHRLIEIAECRIADDAVNRHLGIAREWLTRGETRIRRLEIASTGDGGVVFLANAEGPWIEADVRVHEELLADHPTVRGVVVFGKGWRHEFGDVTVHVALDDDLALRVRGGFTQVNPEGNRLLVRHALAALDPGPDDRVLELYCGAGNFSLPVALRAGEVVGIDSDARAIRAARENADDAGVGNVRFERARVGEAVVRLADLGEQFTAILLDPPRAGAAEAIPAMTRLGARRIVYVSCDPATLARDLGRLVTSGLRVTSLQPIDLFPQTQHVEVVAKLE